MFFFANDKVSHARGELQPKGDTNHDTATQKHASAALNANSAAVPAGVVISAAAQSPTAAPWPSSATWDNDINRTELNNFDRYLDDHPEVARELRNNPRLIDNPNWLAQHPSTQQFLNNHPGVNEEIRENPRQFVNRENRFERNGGDISRREAANADNYLDRHPEIAHQLQRDPRLIDNPNYVANHPACRTTCTTTLRCATTGSSIYAFESRQRQYEHHEYRKPATRSGSGRSVDRR